MDLRVFPISIPPPTSLSTQSLWVFPVYQARALLSCIQPGLIHFFFNLLCFRSPYSRLQWKLNSFLKEGWILSSFWFLPSYSLSSVFCKLSIGWDVCWVFVCLFVFVLISKAEWAGNPVCSWSGLNFCFVCCLCDMSFIGCYRQLGNAGSWIQVDSFEWVLTIGYSHFCLENRMDRWAW